jgi:RND family efflux transporter MFP subunit
VQIATVTAGPDERQITLLGDTRPYLTATLYSKIGGYLRAIHVDRGDVVTSGQVLAEVDSAETDSLYTSALTDLENKRRNAGRAHDLVAHGSMSVQAADQADTDFRMAAAHVAQVTTLKSYEVMRAPFGGRVTARFVDPGALVTNAATNQTSSQPVLTLADDSRLRVDVYVEQRDVPFIHVGDAAEVSDAADRTRTTKGVVARSAGQLDPRTRTLFVELELDNSDHFLVAGSFAYVTLHVKLRSYPEVPASALLTRGNSAFVAVVGKDGTVHLQPVSVARTDGDRVLLAEGVQVGEGVALNLPDEVADGGRVQAVLASR